MKMTVYATVQATVTERWVVELPEGTTLADARSALLNVDKSIEDFPFVSVENETVDNETQREVFEVRAYRKGD